MPKRRRRTFTAEFKAQIALEVLTGLGESLQSERRFPFLRLRRALNSDGHEPE
jgi:hypothetical protein